MKIPVRSTASSAFGDIKPRVGMSAVMGVSRQQLSASSGGGGFWHVVCSQSHARHLVPVQAAVLLSLLMLVMLCEMSGVFDLKATFDGIVRGEEATQVSRCPEECQLHNGTCNEQTGQCSCPPGFTGPHCTDNALPECQLAGGYWLPCFLPSTCECSAACDRYRLSRPLACFDIQSEARVEGGTKESSLTWQDMLSAPQVHMAPGGNKKIVLGEEERVTWMVPAEECPDSCHKRGVCHGNSKTCTCPWFYSGEGCADVAAGCLNECSGRGECEEGVCRCEKHFFGIDCSLSLDENHKPRITPYPPSFWTSILPAPETITPHLLPLVFVYELPGYFNTWQFRHSPAIDLPEAVWLLERLLSSPHRTANPDEADFFYVPLFLRNRDMARHGLLLWTVDYIRQTWPFWNKSNGRDHVFLVSEPSGKCGLLHPGEGHPLLANSITLTPWAYDGMMLKNGGNNKLPCFRLGQDIAIPPGIRDRMVFSQVPFLQPDYPEGQSARENILLFKGPKMKAPEFLKGDSGFHVREKFFELFGERQEESRVRIIEDEGLEPTMTELVGVEFFFAAVTDGWLTSVVLSIFAGCIPVIVQPSISQPFEGMGIDWHTISVQVAIEDMHHLPDILQEVSAEERQKKRDAMKAVWPMLTWTSPHFNPLRDLPEEVQRKYAPILNEKDVFKSIMHALDVVKSNPREDSGSDMNEVIEQLKKEWSGHTGGGPAGAEEAVPAELEAAPSKEQPTEARAEQVVENPIEGSRPETEPDELETEGPDLSRESKCSEGCLGRGTCNEETGECYCQAGFKGDTCSDYAMPACHLYGDDAFIPCALFSTCGCQKECAEFRFGNFECVNEIKSDGSVETDLKKVFTSPSFLIRFDAEMKEASRVRIGNDLKRREPKECPMECSGRGACLRDQDACDCTWYHHGLGCERFGDIPFGCFNDCYGHGNCVEGVCVCDRGYFGLDCQLYIDSEGKTKRVKRRPFKWAKYSPPPGNPSNVRPKIFVYELPGYFNSWQFTQNLHMDWQDPIWFLERLLASEFRTVDPEEANFFYLPLLLRNRAPLKLEIIKWAIEYISNRWPFWNRKNGKDHIVLTNDDWGNCEIGAFGEMSPVLENMTTITLWGHTKNMRLENKNPCFRKGRDVVIPPFMAPDVYRYVPFLQGEKEEAQERSILLYFKGFNAVKSNPSGPYRWSFGVRQKMFELYHDKFEQTGILFESTEGAPGGYLEQMLKSKFCFAPSGWGWGMRATQNVMLGCIPVVIQPNVVQAFEGDGLDWEDFAVVLTFEDIPNIEAILRGIPEEKLAEKRRGLEAVWTKFVYSSWNWNPLVGYSPDVVEKFAEKLYHGDMFMGVIEALKLRLER